MMISAVAVCLVHVHMQEGQAAAISLLLQHGADPTLCDKRGRSGELNLNSQSASGPSIASLTLASFPGGLGTRLVLHHMLVCCTLTHGAT